jgi:hypothetical protein
MKLRTIGYTLWLPVLIATFLFAPRAYAAVWVGIGAMQLGVLLCIIPFMAWCWGAAAARWCSRHRLDDWTAYAFGSACPGCVVLVLGFLAHGDRGVEWILLGVCCSAATVSVRREKSRLSARPTARP